MKHQYMPPNHLIMLETYNGGVMYGWFNSYSEQQANTNTWEFIEKLRGQENKGISVIDGSTLRAISLRTFIVNEVGDYTYFIVDGISD